jgi:D-3-phosphoglycerate dehydrogenase
MGAQTEESNINAGVAAARQVVEYFNSGKEKYRLNK